VKETIDEYEMSFSVNAWDKVLYDGVKEIKIDIFYNAEGHPKQIHDSFGASAIDEFRLAVINEVLERNSADEIWRISHDGFAITSKESNCASFTVEFRGIKQTILKKTIKINAYEQ
jgi:hypothetical protein